MSSEYSDGGYDNRQYAASSSASAPAPPAPSPARPGYPPTSADWESYRAIFTNYYSTEGRRLSEVIQLMKDNYGFHATTRMYKKRIGDWNLQKNYNLSQMQGVATVLQQYRDADQNLPRLLLNGEDIDLQRVRRFYRDRYDDRRLARTVVGNIDYFLGREDRNDANNYVDLSTQAEDNAANESYQPYEPQEMTIARRVMMPSDGNNLEEVLHASESYSKWCFKLDASMFDESYEELVHTPLEKGYVSRPAPQKNADSQIMWVLFQDGLKMLEASNMQLAFDKFNHGCHLFKSNLKAKPNFVLRLVVREFGAGAWQDFEVIRQCLFSYILRMTSSVLGVSHPLSQALRGLLKMETFDGSSELVLKVLIDACKEDLGSGHKEIFRLMRGLSVVYRRQNDLQLSEQILLTAIRESEALNGVKNDQTRRCLSRLANQYGDQGRYIEAERIYEHVLRGADFVNDGLDDITICTFQNLANVANKQGDEEKRSYWLAQEGRVRAALETVEVVVIGHPGSQEKDGSAEGSIDQAAGTMQVLGIHSETSSGESDEALTPPSDDDPPSGENKDAPKHSSAESKDVDPKELV